MTRKYSVSILATASRVVLFGLFIQMLWLSSRAATIWTGPDVTWTKSSSTPSDTIIPGKVVLRRGSNNVLYNTAAGETSAGSTSPKDTMWAFGDIANATTLTYHPLAFYRNGNLAGRILNQPMVVHLIAEDIYFSITFTVWGQHLNGGVSYTRSTAPAVVPPTVSITGPSEGATFTAPASFDLTANASVSGGTVGKVEYFANGVSLGSATSDPFRVTANIPNPGSYTLTAVATANGVTGTSPEVHINVVSAPAPTVSITGPSEGATFTAPASFDLTANASVSGGTVSKVEYFANGASLGSATSDPFRVTANIPNPGSYTLTAVATANGVTGTSPEVHISVVSTPTPTVSITSPAEGAVFAAPANVNISANATVSSGTISSVSFFSEGNILGNIQSAPFNFTANNLGAGSHSLTAVATASGISATSGPVHITVVAPDQTISLSPPTLSNGLFSFNYNANPGLSYVIQAASALNSSGSFDWAAVTTNVATSAQQTYSQTVSVTQARFFRVGRLANP